METQVSRREFVMRLIARLDIKSGSLIKGVRFEGVRKLGNPSDFAQKYYVQGIDEIVFIDTVASLYGRPQLGTIVETVSNTVFVPLTVGGGIRSIHDAESLFQLGADKVAINSAGVTNPKLLNQIASTFGSQALVGSIHAKRRGTSWECLTEQGREQTGIDLRDRIRQLIDQGAGEILITSVDNDGVRRGFDLDLCDAAVSASSVPVVLGGGCGSVKDLLELRVRKNLSGIAVGSAFHYEALGVAEAKLAIRDDY